MPKSKRIPQNIQLHRKREILGGSVMELDIIIEKINDDVVIPLNIAQNELQVRSDGILLSGELHLWEEIMFVHITNRELMNKLKKKI